MLQQRPDQITVHRIAWSYSCQIQIETGRAAQARGPRCRLKHGTLTSRADQGTTSPTGVGKPGYRRYLHAQLSPPSPLPATTTTSSSSVASHASGARSCTVLCMSCRARTRVVAQAYHAFPVMLAQSNYSLALDRSNSHVLRVGMAHLATSRYRCRLPPQLGLACALCCAV